MIGHAIDSNQLAVVIVTESIDEGVEVAFVCFGDCRHAPVRSEGDVVVEFGVCHTLFWFWFVIGSAGASGLSPLQHGPGPRRSFGTTDYSDVVLGAAGPP